MITNKLIIILAMLLIAVTGCSTQNDATDNQTGQMPNESPTASITSSQQLILTDEDLAALGMAGDCTFEEYEASEYSSLMDYAFCNYTIADHPGTEVIIELKKFTNKNDINGSYQYESSHLLGAKGIISENTYGDQSKFHVNSDDDYGAEFNTDDTVYYHLWITKDLYYIHITSKGVESDKEYIENIADKIMDKFN